MAGISINVLSNVREAVRGAEDVADVIDEVSDALNDLTKEGDQATDRMADDFKDFSKKAEREADAVKDAMRQAFKDGRAAVKDSTDDATKDVKKFGDTAKDEFRDSAREGAASFSGEFSDVTDVFQEVAANLGPAGIVGGVIIGSVLSVATAAVEKWNEKIKGIQDATAEMWAAAAEEGQKYVDGEAIRSEAIAKLHDDAFKADFETAEEYGVKRSDLAIALAEGEGETYERVFQQLNDARDEQLRKQNEYYDNAEKGQQTVVRLNTGEVLSLDGVIGTLDEKSKAVENGKRLSQDAQAVSDQLHQQERDQINRTADAAKSRYEAIAREKYNIKVGLDDSAVRGWVPPKLTATVTLVPAASGIFRAPGGRYIA